MAESRLIQKQLAGKEDLLLGVGTVSQARATGVKTITKLNATHFGGVLVVDTINDLNTLDKNQLDEQVVFVKEDGHTYIYNETSWVTKTTAVDTLSDLRSISYPANTVWASGYHAKNDGAFGSHIFRLKGVKTTETDNSGTVIIATIGGTDYVYELQYDGAVNVRWFGAKGDGLTDDTTAIQTAIDTGGNIIFPTGTYIVTVPLILETAYQQIKGINATIQAGNSFTATNNKGIIECLTRKNSTNLHDSLEGVIIDSLQIDGNSKTIAGIALSGFVRGSSVRNCSIYDCYHGIMISGSWSSEIYNNRISGATAVGILIGEEIDFTIDDAGGTTYTDNGTVTFPIEQEGYEYSPGSISIQCNDLFISRNTATTCEVGLSLHFGNAISILSNTLEDNNNSNLRITAIESGAVKENYLEGSRGIIFGRDSVGAFQNSSFLNNFLSGQNILMRAMSTSQFLYNNLTGGTAVTSTGAYQRRFGNLTQFPNTQYGADNNILSSNYTFDRDGVWSTDEEKRVTHSGYFTSVLDGCYLNSQLNVVEAADNTALTLISQDNGQNLKARTKTDVSTSAVTIGFANLGAFVVVIGYKSNETTANFIDLVLAISYNSATVVSAKARGTVAARTYTMSGNNLQLTMASDTYRVSTTSLT